MNGPSAPNALLLQRLDAVLGVPLSKYARPATAPFPLPEHPGHEAAPGADGRSGDEDGAIRAPGRTGRRPIAPDTSVPGQNATDSTAGRRFPSSPTTLGQAARAILTLLQQLPQQPPAVVLRQPMLPGADTLPAATLLAAATPHPQPTLADGLTPRTGQPPSTASLSATPFVPGNSAVQPAAMQASSPLVTLLAQHLMQQVSQSGMFYEAQLARVAFEGQPADTLRQQPQSSLPALAGADRGAPPAAAVLAGQGGTPLAPEHAMLVRQQLEVLATQTWQARGEAWPGAPMHWEIQRDAMPALLPELPGREGNDDDGNDGNDGNAGEEEAGKASAESSASAWRTRLRLQLPHLGEVNVALSLRGMQCELQFESASHESVLHQASPMLQQRLAAAGLDILSLDVQQAGPMASMARQAEAAETAEAAPAATATDASRAPPLPARPRNGESA
ncbi:flagellar hook-length control protein FliK [Kerstersia gyiorum]|uniref:flagellar hook-length control protein FliK n=1 Tax=Kerstersia gyiorum TaxID=206506 RepID=UPI003B4363F5